MRGESYSIEQTDRNRRRWSSALRAAISALAICTLPLQKAHAAEDDARAVIIFDGSGSMWGRLDGRTKYDIARRSMAAILPSYNRQIALGLIAYGHRRKSDCNDIEILAAPEPGQALDIVDSIRSLRPRGKTPIASSLESAATLLADRNAGHIVVLTDGVENCRQDLCDTVDAIREAAPGLTISTIGLGLRDKDVDRVRCVARRGGGRFVVANDADTLRAGLLDILDDIASGVTFEPDLTESGTQTATTTPDAAQTPPRLQLRALASDNGPLIQDAVQWQVLRVDGANTTGQSPLFAETTPTPDLDVTTGTFRVVARLGQAQASREITITEGGPRSVHLPLDVARIDLKIPAPLVGSETIAVVQKSSTNDTSVPPTLFTSATPPPERIYLPPGDYVIRRDGSSVSDVRPLSLVAGDTNTIDFDRSIGTLKPTAALPPDEAGRILRTALTYRVERQVEAGPGRWIEVARSAAPAPVFALPAGRYRVTAELGTVKDRQRIEVEAGKTSTHDFPLNAGILQLQAIDLAGGTLPTPLRFTVTRTDIATSQPHLTSQSTARMVLAPGTYRVEARAGFTNLVARTEVVLNAGTVETAEITFDSATVILQTQAPENAPPQRNLAWEIRPRAADGTQRPIWSGAGRDPVVTLAPGQYTVTVRIRERTTTRNFAVPPGTRQTVTLPAP